MEYAIIQKTSAEVITLSQAKSWLRVSGDYDDTNIQLLIDTAYDYAQNHMQIDLLTTTYETYIKNLYENLTLRRGVGQSLVKIEYLKEGIYLTLDSEKYSVQSSGIFIKLNNFKDLPQVDYDCKAYKITFKTGFGDTADSVPATIKTGMLNHIYSLYERSCTNELPNTVKSLYDSYTIILPYHE